MRGPGGHQDEVGALGQQLVQIRVWLGSVDSLGVSSAL